jgi:hypothetical protein
MEWLPIVFYSVIGVALAISLIAAWGVFRDVVR